MSYIMVTQIICILFVALVHLIDLTKAADDQYRIVKTFSGSVRGQKLTTVFENKDYYSFKGIPYATPPTYNLRFLPPKPVKKWTTVRDCFEYANTCLQYNLFNTTVLQGDEDCLYLNIFTPDVAMTAEQSVMVYFGGYFFGADDNRLLGPDFLVNEGVVVVTLSYRIGVMGWLSLGTPKYSGNQGLKDQRLALKWISANIRRFGGHPKKVTIFGQSAGSSSCHFHLVAPGSQGLFQKSIEMSNSFTVYAYFEKGHHLDLMYEFAKHERRPAINYADLVSFLQTVDPEVMVKHFKITVFHSEDTPITVYSPFLPVLENSAALEPFLQVTPEEILFLRSFNTSVDVMTGFTDAESLFFNVGNVLNPARLNKLNENFAIQLPSMYFNQDYNSEEYKAVAQEIRDHYFPDDVAINLDAKTLRSYVQLMSDVYQTFPIDRKVRLLAHQSSGNTFYYRFKMDSQLNYYKVRKQALSLKGAIHGDDLWYIFKSNAMSEIYANVTIGSQPYALIKRMTGLYTNFAKTGNPIPSGSPDFQPVQSNKLTFLDITNTEMKVLQDPNKDDVEFWNVLMLENQYLLNKDLNANLDVIIRLITTP